MGIMVSCRDGMMFACRYECRCEYLTAGPLF